MKHIILLLILFNASFVKADEIYHLRDSLGIEDINKIDSLNVVILDSQSFDYVISDSTRQYKIYASVPLYDLIKGEVRIISNGFDIKFNSIKELMIFLFNVYGIQISKERIVWERK